VLVTVSATVTDVVGSATVLELLELESSRAWSPEAHATPTSSNAAATAVNTPSNFLYIDRPPW
jgi:hypothetical protein